MALRGHASIQGSTDIPTLFNLLPGYLPMPHADAAPVARRVRAPTTQGTTGLLGQHARLRGQPAQGLLGRRGDRRRTTSASTTCRGSPATTATYTHGDGDRSRARCKGYFLVGENPAVGSANGKMQRLGLANLDWLVVRDLQMIESATFWKDGPEIETGELVTEEIGTEVFFLPAASHVEKAGTFTQTQRMLQWRDKAVEPPGDCPQRPVVLLPPRAGSAEKLAGLDRRAGPAAARPGLGLPDRRASGEPERRGGAARDQRHRARRQGAVGVHRAEGRRLDRRAAAGSTAASTPTRSTRRARRKPRLGAGPGRRRVGLGVAGQPADPLQPRLGRPRRQAVERAQEVRLVGRASRRSGPAHDVPDFDRRTSAPDYVPAGGRDGRRTRSAAPTRSSCRPTARPGCSRRPGWPTGRCRRTTSRRSRRCATRSTASRPTRPREQLDARRATRSTRQLQRRLPVRVHHLPADRAPHRRRDEPDAALPGRAAAGAVLRGVAAAGRASAGSSNGGWATIVTARAAIEARVLVTERMRLAAGRRPDRSSRSALPYHWGGNGHRHRRLGQRPGQRHHGPERATSRSKVGTCDIRPGRRPRGAGAARRTSRTTVAGPAIDARPTPRATEADGTDGAASLCGPARRRRPATPATPTTTRRGWASSPTPRCASAARPARWPARSGTTSPTTATLLTGMSYDNTQAARREHLAARGLHREAARRRPSRSTSACPRRRAARRGTPHGDGPGATASGDGERPLADVVRRLQALHPRRLPRRLPDRGAVPHRVRHRRRPAATSATAAATACRPARTA